MEFWNHVMNHDDRRAREMMAVPRFGEGNVESTKPLTLAGYAAGDPITCYVEPTEVGSKLVPMPLFLDVDHYVNVPLEETYMAAYVGVPSRWKRVIEGRRVAGH